MVSSVKDKYIVRSIHNQLGALKFLPANGSEARAHVKSFTKYETENYYDRS